VAVPCAADLTTAALGAIGLPVSVGQPAYNHQDWATKTCADLKYERMGLQRPWMAPSYADFMTTAVRRSARQNYVFQRGRRRTRFDARVNDTLVRPATVGI